MIAPSSRRGSFTPRRTLRNTAGFRMERFFKLD
jgi:hypothetical protein